jgi:hypothetical protein
MPGRGIGKDGDHDLAVRIRNGAAEVEAALERVDRTGINPPRQALPQRQELVAHRVVPERRFGPTGVLFRGC